MNIRSVIFLLFVTWGGIVLLLFALSLIGGPPILSIGALVRLAIILGVVGGACVVWRLLTARLFDPLDTLIDRLDRLAGGDLEVFVPNIDSKGDIGRLARAIYKFKQETRENIRLRNEQEAFRESMRRQQQTLLLALAERFEEEVAQIAESLATNAADMAGTAQHMMKDAEVAFERAASVRDKADTSREDVEALSEAGTNIQNISQEMSSAIEGVAGRITTLRDVVEQTVTRFASLEQASASIHDVVTLISDITERTNLLALNATIEASRAGEAGQGFRVVAEEVKSLAGQTSDATRTIAEHVKIIQSQVTDSGAAMTTLRTSVQDSVGTVRDIAARANDQGRIASAAGASIDASMDRIGGILTDVGELSSVIEESRTLSRGLCRAAAQVEKMGRTLQAESTSFLQQIREEGESGCKDTGEIEMF